MSRYFPRIAEIKLSNLRLGAKLGAAFFLMVALTAGVGVLSMLQLQRMNSDTGDIADNWLPGMQALANLRNSPNEFRRAEALHVMAPDDDEMASLERRMGDLRKRVTATLGGYEALISSPEERHLHDELARQLDAYYASNGKLIELSGGEGKLAQTKRYFRENSEAALGAAATTISALIERNARGGNEAREAAQVTFSLARVWITGMIAEAVILAALLALWLTRLITRPVAQAVRAAERIADGDLTVELSAQGKDKTAQLLRARGAMKDRLAAMVAGVRENAEGVATASTQIAQGNQDLSSRTEEQASALEQTAASMEELGSTVTQNAENARQANQLALEASSIATRGGDVVGRVVGTMKEINDGSKRIADIIGVIDGIAFQTNILALNAAVEAARAGEQGRGFAVVAGEVRSLAQRSADAAKEIKGLISVSVDRVGQGTALVDQAGATMTEIVGSIRRVTDIMGKISAASTEQSKGVAQVGEAVSQMDQATQQNAALVEQSAAAAESRREQARALVQAMAVFKLAPDEDRAASDAQAFAAVGQAGAADDAGSGHPGAHDAVGRSRAGVAASAATAMNDAPARSVRANDNALTRASAASGYTGIERRGPNRAKNVMRPGFGGARPASTSGEASKRSGSLGAAAANSDSDSWESF